MPPSIVLPPRAPDGTFIPLSLGDRPMRAFLLVSAVAPAGHATVASAQYTAPAKKGGIKLSDVAGTWDVKSVMGPKDSVVVPSVVTATADGKGWTIKLANRDPIPARILAVGGDSVVMEAGPYRSEERRVGKECRSRWAPYH